MLIMWFREHECESWIILKSSKMNSKGQKEKHQMNLRIANFQIGDCLDQSKNFKISIVYHMYTIFSDESELSSARIQLELEAFQLGSARGILSSAPIVRNLAKRAICTICKE